MTRLTGSTRKQIGGLEMVRIQNPNFDQDTDLNSHATSSSGKKTKIATSDVCAITILGKNP